MMMIIAVATPGVDETITDTVGTLINAVSIDDYGAVGDGTTDDTAALQAAVATGYHVWIPKNKTYAMPGVDFTGGIYATVKPAAGQYIIGEDRDTSILKITQYRGVQLSEFGSGCFNLTFQGAGQSAGMQYNTGIVVFGPGVRIEGCLFKGFSGTAASNGGGGVLIPNITAITGFKRGSNFFDNDFTDCKCGINTYGGGEYVSFSGGRIWLCETAIVNRGGNNKYSNFNITECGTGFSLQAGINDGHGSLVNSTVNHNTTNLTISGITLGFIFSSTFFGVGNITITTSNRIMFSACHLVGAGTLTLTSNTANGVKVGAECYYPTSGGDELTKVLTGNDIVIV